MHAALRALFAWEGFWWIYEKAERRRLFAEARGIARKAGKPLLVVGEPFVQYPCPDGSQDVLVDLREKSACSNHLRASIEDLKPIRDGRFGAAVVQHTLEHVCDPVKALSELRRVADVVLIGYPRPWRLATYLVPGHRWIMIRRGSGWRFIQLYGECNLPTRYGISGGLAVIDVP